MSAGLAALVALAGGLGALLRLLVARAVTVRSHGRPLAIGTFAVNLSGAFLLGLLVGLAPGTHAAMIVGTGLLGGYTTFSTWMFESQRFVREAAARAAAINVVASAALGLGAVWLGRAIAGT